MLKTARHPQIERILSSNAREPITIEELEDIIDEIGMMRGPQSLPHLRDLTLALASCTISINTDNAHDLSARRARAQEIFWQLVEIGATHDEDGAALILEQSLRGVLSLSRWPNSPLHAPFDRGSRGAEGERLLDRFEARIIEGEGLDVDTRLEKLIERFPTGHAMLPQLVQRSQQLHTHASGLLDLYFNYSYEHVLSRAVLEHVWEAAPTELRIDTLKQLGGSKTLLERASDERWDMMFVERAKTDQERATLLHMRRSLHNPRWSKLACELLDSPNPDLRKPALDTLEESATREALPALVALRSSATRAEKEQLARIIGAIHKHDPAAALPSGALSLAEAQSHEGALSIAQAQGGELSAPGGPAPLVAQEDDPRAALLERWSHVAPAPRRVSPALVIVLRIFGLTGRRALAWLWFIAGVALVFAPPQAREACVMIWSVGALFGAMWAWLGERSGVAIARDAHAALATVEQVAYGQTHLKLADGSSRQLPDLNKLALKVGDHVPVFRSGEGGWSDIVPLERCRTFTIAPDGQLKPRPLLVVLAAPIMIGALCGLVCFVVLLLMLALFL